MRFFKTLLAVILGFFIALLLLFFITLAGASSVASSAVKKVTVENNAVLTLKLNKPIKDYAPKETNPLAKILEIENENLDFSKILNAIENAKTDAKIKGISIEAMALQAGISQLQTLRDKLEDFKTSGKFITAYADYYDQRNYYLSSVADSMYVNPVGALDFKGLATEILFFKDFEDKFGVKYEVIRHGKYKSAVEPFIANTISDSNREQTKSFLTSIWKELLEDIGKSRQKSSEEMNAFADNLSLRTPTKALENNMIDGVLYADQYTKMLQNTLGISSDSKVEKITLEDYISTGKGRKNGTSSNKIAVIYAQGEIKYGKGNIDYVGQEKIIEALHKALKKKSVKAIVLRVNSPGGSALASDLIWRELALAKNKKPLVVSMGNLAASGGYYIACNADKIFAEPTTITGSIGVFGAIPNFSKAANTLGVNAERVATNKGAFYSVYEPISKDFYDVTKEGVEHIYNTFVDRVATGRNMTFEQVDKIAQGRVWTGKQALENGLVDTLGSLEDAIAAAAGLAAIESYKTINYPRYKKNFKDLMSPGSLMHIKEKMIEDELGKANIGIYKKVVKPSKYQGIQMRLPFDIDIK